MICVVCSVRVVHEIHNSSTKKNNEWQEMLPVVVLKAEEILYSKASSEVFSFFLFSFLPFSAAANFSAFS